MKSRVELMKDEDGDYIAILIVPQDDGGVWIQQRFTLPDVASASEAETIAREWARREGVPFWT